jgi:hypothetical protein
MAMQYLEWVNIEDVHNDILDNVWQVKMALYG